MDLAVVSDVNIRDAGILSLDVIVTVQYVSGGPVCLQMAIIDCLPSYRLTRVRLCLCQSCHVLEWQTCRSEADRQSM